MPLIKFAISRTGNITVNTLFLVSCNELLEVGNSFIASRCRHFEFQQFVRQLSAVTATILCLKTNKQNEMRQALF
jgi:DNA polymerase III delta prime subunit